MKGKAINQGLVVPCKNGKTVIANSGDCIVTYRAVKALCFMPISKGICMSLTTSCDHDIGIVVEYVDE